jgi:hypothetical protein
MHRSERIRIPDQFAEHPLTFAERPRAHILAVEVQEVKGEEDDPIRLVGHGAIQRLEVRTAMLVLDDDLAIDHGAPTADLRSVAGDPRVFLGPVMAIAAEGARLAAVDNQLRPVAVVLDLVEPAFPGWRHVDQRQQVRRHEAGRAQGACLGFSGGHRQASRRSGELSRVF